MCCFAGLDSSHELWTLPQHDLVNVTFFPTYCLAELTLFVKTTVRECCLQSPTEIHLQVPGQWPGKADPSEYPCVLNQSPPSLDGCHSVFLLPLADLLGSLTSSSCCATGHLTEWTPKQRGMTPFWSASEALSSKTSPVERAMLILMTHSAKESKYCTHVAALIMVSVWRFNCHSQWQSFRSILFEIFQICLTNHVIWFFKALMSQTRLKELEKDV